MRARSIVATWALAACGRVGFAPAPATVDAPEAVTIAPVGLLAQTAKQLAATVDGVATAAVTWEAVDGGTVSATGVFVAPAVDGDYHVRATSVADPTKSGLATIHVGASTPATIASTGALANPSGRATQHHLVYAADTRAWWIWYTTATDATRLHAARTLDGATWIEGPPLELGVALGSDGANLDVADRVLGGHHVVHLSVNTETNLARYHVRATLDGGVLVYGQPRMINAFGGSSFGVDGTSLVILPSGFVVDATGWESTPPSGVLGPCGTGDMDIYASTQADSGTTSFDAMTYAETILWCVPGTINSRRLLADGETIHALYENTEGSLGDGGTNLFANIRLPDGTWTPDETTYTVPPRVFATDTEHYGDDWDAVIAGRTLHAIRRLHLTNTIEHATYALDAATGWIPGAPIGPAPAPPGSGIVIVPYGAGVLAAQLATPGPTLVEYTFFDGATWTPWLPLVANATGDLATAIAAGSADGASPVITWTSTTNQQLVGDLLP